MPAPSLSSSTPFWVKVSKLPRTTCAAAVECQYSPTVLRATVRSARVTALVLRTYSAYVASESCAKVTEEARAPGSKDRPYQASAPALCPRRMMGCAAVPLAISAPCTTNSTREVLVPEAMPSVAEASTTTPGSMVSVACGAMVRSPVSR